MPATADRPARSAAAHPGRAALPEDLSAGQREMIETGLRYVRSSLTMEVCEPTSPVARKAGRGPRRAGRTGTAVRHEAPVTRRTKATGMSPEKVRRVRQVPVGQERFRAGK